MKKLLFKNSHPTKERTFDNTARVLNKTKTNSDKALEFLNQSLKMKKLLYKNEPHQSIVVTLNNISQENWKQSKSI